MTDLDPDQQMMVRKNETDQLIDLLYEHFDGKEVVTRFARHRMEERAAIVAWLKKENGLCDCFARSEGECACGAWDDYKTVPIERIWQAIEAGEHLK